MALKRVERPPLAKDSMVSSLLNKLRSTLSQPLENSPLSNLAQMGILTSRNGELEVKEKKLKDAFEQNPMAIADAFTSKNGLLNKLKSTVVQYTGGKDENDITIKGIIDERGEKLKKTQKGFESQWEQLRTRKARITERYKKELIAMDIAMTKMNQTLSSLMQPQF